MAGSRGVSAGKRPGGGPASLCPWGQLICVPGTEEPCLREEHRGRAPCVLPLSLRTCWTRLMFQDPNGHGKTSSLTEGQTKGCIYIQHLYPDHSTLMISHNYSPHLTFLKLALFLNVNMCGVCGYVCMWVCAHQFSEVETRSVRCPGAGVTAAVSHLNQTLVFCKGSAPY